MLITGAAFTKTRPSSVPLVLEKELSEASPSSATAQLIQNTNIESDSSVPLLNNKLVARLRNIDGPVLLHQNDVQGNELPEIASPIGELGRATRPLNTAIQPLLSGRKTC